MNGEVKRSDLGVRTASAVVMMAVSGFALWIGGYLWFGLTVLVALVCLYEFIRLILRATVKPPYRILGIFGAVAYVIVPVFLLGALRYSWTDDVGWFASIASVLFVVGVVIATDVGAYFFGRAIGGPKIAPKISPSKTWAGLAGGMIVAAIWTMTWRHFFDKAFSGPSNTWLDFLTFAMIGSALAIIAQSGDFFQSWLKRKADVKDSSNLIPGHGGVFDRIDGLLPVVLASQLFHLRPF